MVPLAIASVLLLSIGVSPPQVDSKAKSPPVTDTRKVETDEDKMFPDGFTHDFGTVQRGTQVRHVFRVVNTTGKPLKISSVRQS
jgi:hypothetical protein